MLSELWWRYGVIASVIIDEVASARQTVLKLYFEEQVLALALLQSHCSSKDHVLIHGILELLQASSITHDISPPFEDPV